MSQNATRVYEIYIHSTPERMWQSLTDPELTQQYYFNTRVESDWKSSSTVVYRNPQGNVDLEGEVLEIDPPRRLVTTFKPTWAPQVTGTAPSTVSWEIESIGEACKLTLTHAGFDQDSPMADMIHNAWIQTLSSLKSLLETGQPLNFMG